MSARFSLHVSVLVAALLVVAGCTPRVEDLPAPERGDSFLRIIHASSQLPQVDILADYYNIRQFILRDFAFGQSFPEKGYLTLDAADPVDEFGYTPFRLRATQVGSPDTLALTAPLPIPLDPFSRYSVYLYPDSGLQRLAYFRDSYSTRDSNFAAVRLVNVSSGRRLRLLIGSTFTSQPVATGFATIFSVVAVGTYNVDIYDEDAGAVAATIANVQLLDRKAYSFHLADGVGYVTQLN